MENFSIPIQLRWSDIDANRHLRHSAYYDFGAAVRVKFLSERGITSEKLEELKIGPVLFREEAIFKREVKFEDQITIDMQLVKCTPDYGRWSIRHNIVKADGTLAAVINIDAAWIDLVKRKLTLPPEFILHIFETFPKSPDFQFIIPEKKA
ncbi:MAG TPA: acyl-CoA thioesterase [Cyclobacteriaceae bacterium]|nr:acyl-CoA thioesterase [Cyclobacteriaceae bacterium]